MLKSIVYTSVRPGRKKLPFNRMSSCNGSLYNLLCIFAYIRKCCSKHLEYVKNIICKIKILCTLFNIHVAYILHEPLLRYRPIFQFPQYILCYKQQYVAYCT